MSMRSSLVVGLGGTGSFAVAELKSRLITDNRWSLLGSDLEAVGSPEYQRHRYPVQLLALDVDKIHRPSVGGIRLDRMTEDLTLDAPVGKIINSLRQTPEGQRSAYPSIETWLTRDEASKLEVNEATTFMTSGAGQIRQFGRIAFCLDVLNQKQVVGRLGTAVAQLAAASDPQGECGVYIVASVAGGAGGGLLIDTLLYLKEERARLASHVAMRTFVFVVLPSTFAAVLAHDKLALSEANGYGALRELDRLINAPKTVKVAWTPNREIRPDGAVADHVYLIDGSRDLDHGRPLEHETKPELAFPAAIADAIYAHIFPSSGKVLTRDYPNLLGALSSDKNNRYSTFGSYVLQYDWERLMRSSIARGAGEILDGQLRESGPNARDLAEKFLLGKAPDKFTNDKEYQALPALLTEVLSSPDAATGGLDPVSRWLAPAEGAPPFPETPTLTDLFPDLQKWLTRWSVQYSNDQVLADTGEQLKSFWGDNNAVWAADASEPRFYPVANTNQKLCERDFSRSLHLATAAVMNLNTTVGSIPAASVFLAAVDACLESYGRYLDRITLAPLEPYSAAVESAKEEMRTRRENSRAQHHYLDAEQALLNEQRRNECLVRARRLIAGFRHLTKQVIDEVTGWRATLGDLKDKSKEERLSVDNERTASNESPVRRLVPLPGSTVERGLYDDCVGQMDTTLNVPEQLLLVMSARRWRVHTKRDTSQLVWVRRGRVAPENAPAPDADPVLIELSHLTDELTKVFLPLRGRHIFEILEREELKPAELADELRFGAARLAAFDHEVHLRDGEGDIGVQDWNYVFADWRTDGAGSELAVATKRILDESAPKNAPKPSVNLGDLPKPGSMPTMDKVVAFSARHLILLDALQGVKKLKSSYRDRRLKNPSPHVLPEEKGAATLEALSEELARQGHLGKRIEIQADLVSLCSDVPFLQRFAMVVANNLIEHDVEDELGHQGKWLLADLGANIEIGTEWELERLIPRVAFGQDHKSLNAKGAIKKYHLRLAREPEAILKLRQYALGETSNPLKMREEVQRVLQVAAAQLATLLSTPRSR